MPINRRLYGDPDVIYTLLYGRVTDDELLSYYMRAITEIGDSPWREIVDGTLVTEMALTTEGLKRLAGVVESNLEKLRGGRVAMVAASDITYGVFRMWELRREGLNYEVRVFRELDAALAWL